MPTPATRQGSAPRNTPPTKTRPWPNWRAETVGPRRRPTSAAATAIAARMPIASQIVPCRTKTTAHATKTDANAQTSVVVVLRWPSARATSRPGRSTSRVAKASLRYSTKRLHVGRGEEADALTVGPPSLSDEEQGAQAQRPEQQAAGALGLADAAVFRLEPQVAAEVLDVHPAAVGGAADVHDLGAGIEPDGPAGLPEAEHPVGLLAEHEELLV